jgi:hypothetical protein
MDNFWKESIWRQFAAAIDMLENALRTCPEELWSVRMWSDTTMAAEFSEFWYVAYHALFWLDLYLSGEVEGFSPPEQFSLAELDPAGVLPERTYTRNELQAYSGHCRQKCRETLKNLTDQKALQTCSFSWGQVSFAELLLDNMRHVQEHAAQLNMVLGQTSGVPAKWVSQTKEIGAL